jgi:hypothetical protein
LPIVANLVTATSKQQTQDQLQLHFPVFGRSH